MDARTLPADRYCRLRNSPALLNKDLTVRFVSHPTLMLSLLKLIDGHGRRLGKNS